MADFTTSVQSTELLNGIGLDILDLAAFPPGGSLSPSNILSAGKAFNLGVDIEFTDRNAPLWVGAGFEFDTTFFLEPLTPTAVPAPIGPVSGKTVPLTLFYPGSTPGLNAVVPAGDAVAGAIYRVSAIVNFRLTAGSPIIFLTGFIEGLILQIV